MRAPPTPRQGDDRRAVGQRPIAERYPVGVAVPEKQVMEGKQVKRAKADKQPEGLEEAADGFPPFEQALRSADRVEERCK